MTQKEKNIVDQVIRDIESECEILEDLYLQTRSINFRWFKQSLEEKVVKQLKELMK